ncbi:hypothetical protein GJ496_002780, partial [Pomphorhynchus laevis]
CKQLETAYFVDTSAEEIRFQHYINTRKTNDDDHPLTAYKKRHGEVENKLRTLANMVQSTRDILRLWIELSWTTNNQHDPINDIVDLNMSMLEASAVDLPSSDDETDIDVNNKGDDAEGFNCSKQECTLAIKLDDLIVKHEESWAYSKMENIPQEDVDQYTAKHFTKIPFTSPSRELCLLSLDKI